MMRDLSGNFSSFNNTAYLHSRHVTLRFSEQSTSAFIPSDLWSPNNHDLKPLTDDPSFWYKKLVRESRTRNLYIQVAHRTIQVSRMGNVADGRDDDLAVAAMS